MDIPRIATNVLKVAAPTLLTGLLGPFGGLAAALATKAIEEFLPRPEGVPPDAEAVAASPADVVAAVEANASDPRMILALKEAEARIKQAEAEMGIRFAEIEVQDRADARKTSVDSGLSASIFRLAGLILVGDGLLAALIVLGGFALLSGWFELSADPAVITVIFTLIGTVLGRISGRADQVTNFYYGSTRASGDKTDQIAGTMREMGTALGQAAQRRAQEPVQRPLPAPPVVVVPQPPMPPVAPPAVQPAPGGDRGSDPAVPAPPGLLAEVIPELVRPHRHFQGSVSWALTADGVAVDGAAAVGSPGEPATIRKIWSRYGALCCAAARNYGVPVELIVATIATESRGDPNAHREEPQIGDASSGLMQTLRNTAREALGRPELKGGDLFDPATSVAAGTAYIAQQRGTTHFDPPLVAAAYNAGSIRKDASAANRWRLHCYPKGTGRHVDTYVTWFNDAMRVSRADGWCRDQEATPTYGSCIEAFVGKEP